MESPSESTLANWSAPQCPFVIEYAPRVLDDIRLAVVDAFFSLPRGGAEIGGVLLGKYVNGIVQILSHAALECEHAFGPSFTLSPNDHARLAQLMAGCRASAGGLKPVGWYHSHTRSDIFLSEADLEIHNRYFPDPWQVALVVRPATVNPARAGFFFREADGTVHAVSSYAEFVLEPLALRQIPRQPPASATAPRRPLARMDDGRAVTLTVEPVEDAALGRPAATTEPAAKPVFAPPDNTPAETDRTPPPVVRPEPAPEPPKAEPRIAAAPPPVEVPAARAPEPAPEPEPPTPSVEVVTVRLPGFIMATEEPSRAWVWVAVVAAVAVAATGHQTRDAWYPWVSSAFAKLAARVSSAPETGAPAPAPAPAVPAAIALAASESEGQLQIRWDGASALIRASRDGTLEILDADAKSVVPLDLPHLQSGSFTYQRQGGQVDARLVVNTAAGKTVEQATTFLGQAPERLPPNVVALRKKATDLQKERDAAAEQAAKLKADLAAQTALARQVEKLKADLAAQSVLARQAGKLKSDLAAQTERNRKMDQTIKDLRTQLGRLQQRRLQNQSPDPLE